jgi:tRNA uridine 5-carboxymethylaminomethyl modification enzyme
VQCHIAYTTDETHRVLRENIHRSPLYSGQIEGVGPRYCPSIEDKVVKFPDKPRHQIFLEPEGLDTYEVYVNGMSTSMPTDVQVRMLASVPGLEEAEMIRPGYAIEYDAVDPRQLNHSLMVRSIQGLFLAGQINGTSGYEEAGCQGLVAGLNAAAFVGGSDPVVIGRSEGYTGILIDDLITKGADEPYRMFTSRAEFRLHLRIDNADERLTGLAEKCGLASAERVSLFRRKRGQKERLRRWLETCRLDTEFLGLARDDRPTYAVWLRRPDARMVDLLPLVERELGEPPVRGVLDTLETECKYAGYIDQQQRQVARLKDAEDRRIPAAVDFDGIPGISREIAEKLARVRPETLGQASRIPGMTPAAVAVLEIYLGLRP